jgi:hypothetical protein
MMPHYHIRWSGGVLDWEPFDLRSAAEASAKEMLRPGETYAIEEYGADCAKCRSLLMPKEN